MNHFDIVIKNGRLIDGTANPYFKADIGILDGVITAIERDLPVDSGDQWLDANQRVVTPGFIDAHTHDDLYLMRKPNADEKVLQGITTVITGNCGFSPAPLVKNGLQTLKSFNGILGGGDVIDQFEDQTTFGQFLDLLEKNKPGINVAALIGNVTLRIAVMGHDMRSPTDDELSKMKELVSEAMQSGAIGLSTGLIYAPGSYAQTDELIELAREATVYNGIYTTHMRSESEHLLSSIEEAIKIGQQADLRVQISHFKVAGKNNWGKSTQAIDLIAAARRDGLEITADQYPYNAGSTGLFALLPPDVLSNGVEALSQQLTDTAFRQSLSRRMTNTESEGGMLPESSYDRILIASSPNHPDYEGKTLAEIAETLKQDPLELIFDLVAEEKLAVTMVIYNMHEEDIRNIMQSEFVMMGSDGLPSLGARIHPRMSGTAPRILGRYVREQGVISLEQAIRKMTSLPAQSFRLQNKGLLKVGFDADIVIFDPTTILDGATYDAPTTPPTGIHHVLVNGTPAVRSGQVLGARSGKVLRHAQ